VLIFSGLQFGLNMIFGVVGLSQYIQVSTGFNSALANVQSLNFLNECSDDSTKIDGDAYVRRILIA
jgi:hypothetical protein